MQEQLWLESPRTNENLYVGKIFPELSSFHLSLSNDWLMSYASYIELELSNRFKKAIKMCNKYIEKDIVFQHLSKVLKHHPKVVATLLSSPFLKGLFKMP